MAELRDAVRFGVHELGVNTPWHISRSFPAYQMTDVPQTPLVKLQRVRQIRLKERLHYVYVSNEAVDVGQDTFCLGCGRALIRCHDFGIFLIECKTTFTPIAKSLSSVLVWEVMKGACKISKKVEYLELSARKDFQYEFMDTQFLLRA